MFKTLSKYTGKATAKVANTSTNVAKATPGYLGSVAQEFSQQWKEGYIEQQRKNKDSSSKS